MDDHVLVTKASVNERILVYFVYIWCYDIGFLINSVVEKVIF